MTETKLASITIRGFKSIASIEELTLGPINIVIGANGSGKSNFIGVFDLIHEVGEKRLREYVGSRGGAERVLHFGSKTTPLIAIKLSFTSPVVAYILNLNPTDEDSLYVGSQGATGMGSVLGNLGLFSQDRDRLPGLIDELRGGWRVYHLHDTSSSSSMKKTAQVDDNAYLRADGSNLAAFLYLIKERYESAYRLIRSAVQRVAPFFEDFDLKPSRLRPDSIKLEWRHKRSDQYFEASSLSDGTLRFIALATLFLQPQELQPSVILVDEPELGLHPYAIAMLAALIRQAAVTTQVIVSTQSSLLLDHFDPEDVLVADRVDGGTQIKRLDGSRLEKWLEEYSLGQLWEKNEIGGRPSAE